MLLLKANNSFKVAEQFWQFVSICHLPNYGKRKVAAHKLEDILMKDFD